MRENILLQNEKNRFLADEFFMLSWDAAVQHNRVWKSIKIKRDQIVFRQKIKVKLEKMMLNYTKGIADFDTHIENIKSIQNFSMAEGEELELGKCQKLLNMMCKYYWCIGWIYTPPHMPIDSINLKNLPKENYKRLCEELNCKDRINWTEDLNKEDAYKNVIDSFSKYAKSQGYDSLAIWELCNWKRKSNKE